MELGHEGGNTVEPDAHGGLPSTIGSQPWWRGPGFSAISPVVPPESASSPSPVDLPVGGGGMEGGKSQLHGGVGDAGEVRKEIQNMGAQTDGRYGQEHQHLQPVSAVMPPMMPEYLAPRVQMELGQSVACTAYSYSDPYYAGLMPMHGTQSLLYPQLSGIPHTRMPLQLEMAEEPVYVNAKQYHGILRRRQSRAKLELEKKLIKNRKPYLHESRHQHAMRRARGRGGRFLNTKKTDVANSNTKKGPNSSISLLTKSGNSFSSEALRLDCSGNPDSASTMLEVGRPGMQGVFEPHERASGNDGYQEHSVFQLSTFHTKPGERVEEGDCLGQHRSGILVNRPPNRAVAI